MARPIQPSTPQSRKLADAWLRRSTRAIVLGATGLAAAIGVVVAQEHPGAGSTAGTGSSTSGSSSSNSSGSSDSGSSGSSDNTGATGNTGNSGAATGPSISRSAPAVTSGGSSR
jgi:cytoskeletal protein RodZ